MLSNSVVEHPGTSLSTLIIEGDSAVVGGSALVSHADMPSNVVEDEFMKESTQSVSEPSHKPHTFNKFCSRSRSIKKGYVNEVRF